MSDDEGIGLFKIAVGAIAAGIVGILGWAMLSSPDLPSNHAPQTAARDLEVAITLPQKFEETIAATTNLPNGTLLVATLQAPRPGCRPNCGYAWEKNLVVTDGKIILGPFNVSGEKYELKITSTLPSIQPAEVQAVIGSSGENLSGPLVRDELTAGAGKTIEWAGELTFSSNPVEPPTPTDPYAAGQKYLADQDYQKRKAELLNLVGLAQHAYRCGVIKIVEAQLIFSTGVQRISRADLAAGRSDYHPDLLPAAKAAATDSDLRAKEPGACEYWKKTPESVALIRQEARIALEVARLGR